MWMLFVLWRECQRSTTMGRTSSTRWSHGQWLPTTWLEISTFSVNMLPSSQLIGSHMSWQSVNLMGWTCLYWLRTRKGNHGPFDTPYGYQADTQAGVYNAFICQAPRAGYLGVLWLDYNGPYNGNFHINQNKIHWHTSAALASLCGVTFRRFVTKGDLH